MVDAPPEPRPPRLLAALAKAILATTIVCGVAAASLWQYVRLVSEKLVQEGRRFGTLLGDEYHLDLCSSISRTLNAVGGYLALASLAVYLLWYWRALTFARAAGATVPRAATAIGLYFVPLANLVYPARHMRALIESTALRPPARADEELAERPYRASARTVQETVVAPGGRALVPLCFSAWWLAVAAYTASFVIAQAVPPFFNRVTVLSGLGWIHLGSTMLARVLSLALVVRVSRGQRAQHVALDERARAVAKVESDPEPHDGPPIVRRRVSQPPSVFIELEHEMAERNALHRAKRRERRRTRATAREKNALESV